MHNVMLAGYSPGSAAVADTVELFASNDVKYIHFFKYFDRCHRTNAIFSEWELCYFLLILHIFYPVLNSIYI